MTDLILHHYPTSPFAEKARALLGSRKLRWRSVHIPPIMPKPDLLALTGGYRRTPVLQMGADIYCDTALIARKLDELSREPTLFPTAEQLNAQAIATWGETALFPMAVKLVFQPQVLKERFASEEEAQAFMADRVAMGKKGHQRRVTLAEAETVFGNVLVDLEAQLEDGRDFLLGTDLTIADFGVYHPLWFVRHTAIVAEKLEPFPRVRAWMDRIAALGHGESTELSSAEAIDIARESGVATEAVTSNIADVQVGDQVEVTPADYAMDPVTGELLLADAREIVVRRRDERAGEVAVHFPRFCYMLRKV